jgi:hypothetical protein
MLGLHGQAQPDAVLTGRATFGNNHTAISGACPGAEPSGVGRQDQEDDEEAACSQGLQATQPRKEAVSPVLIMRSHEVCFFRSV